MGKGLNHFFWDFDGTLYDSYPPLCTQCLKGLRDMGLDTGYDEVMRELKVSVYHFITVYAEKLHISADEMSENYRRFAYTEQKDFAPFPGVKEMLQAVVSSGRSNYLYTHRGMEGVEIMERDGLAVYLRDKVTREDGFPLKPAPDALQHLLSKHNLNPDECIMIGDRDIDLDAAKKAGIHTCLFDPGLFYPDYEADFRFSDFRMMRAALLP